MTNRLLSQSDAAAGEGPAEPGRRYPGNYLRGPMGQLRIENVNLTEHFVAECAKFGAALPLRLCDEEPGVVLDASGKDVFAIPATQFSDEEASNLALLFVLAVNTCGGFKATLR